MVDLRAIKKVTNTILKALDVDVEKFHVEVSTSLSDDNFVSLTIFVKELRTLPEEKQNQFKEQLAFALRDMFDDDAIVVRS